MVWQKGDGPASCLSRQLRVTTLSGLWGLEPMRPRALGQVERPNSPHPPTPCCNCGTNRLASVIKKKPHHNQAHRQSETPSNQVFHTKSLASSLPFVQELPRHPFVLLSFVPTSVVRSNGGFTLNAYITSVPGKIVLSAFSSEWGVVYMTCFAGLELFS